MSTDDIDRYIAQQPPGRRQALEHLRDVFRRRYPEATEHIRHRSPHYKLDGRPFAGFYAAKHHSALWVWSDQALNRVKDALADYDIAQSTVRFAPDHLVPPAIVEAVLDARAAEIRPEAVGSD